MANDRIKLLFGLLVGLFLLLVFFLFRGAGRRTRTVEETSSRIDLWELSKSKGEMYRTSPRGKDPSEQYFERMSSDPSAFGDEFYLGGDSLSDREGAAPGDIDLFVWDDAVERVFGPVDSPEEVPDTLVEVPSPLSPPSAPLSKEERMEEDLRRARAIMEAISETASPSLSSSPSLKEEGGGKQERGSDTQGEKDGGSEDAPLEKVASSGRLLPGEDDSGIISRLGAKQPSRGGALRCIFPRSGRIRSGERVSLRILDSYLVGEDEIPENTLLSAVGRLDGGRLYLEVGSVQIEGRIIPLSLHAVDIDGMEGIYCPESLSSRTGRELSSEAVSRTGSSLGGLIGGIAGGLVRSGASLLGGRGERKVEVTSGYEFFLVEGKKKGL